MNNQQLQLIEYCVKNNPNEFNFNKAIEEAAEFTDALIKLQTKHPSNPKRPTREDVLKEYGDFIYRGLIAVLTLYQDNTGMPVGDQIEQHINQKLAKLQQWKDEDKYSGGL